MRQRRRGGVRPRQQKRHRWRHRRHASEVGPRLPMAQPLYHHRQSQPHRPADRPKSPPRVAPPPRAIRPPRTRPSRAAWAAPGLLVRATWPMPRTQPLRGRRRRHRRRRRRRRTLVLILTPCSPYSSTCTCSSRRSFSFCRCTPIWAMRGGSGCAASAWARRPSGITDAWHGSVWQRLGISDCQILSLDRSF